MLAFSGARIFDGFSWYENRALVVRDGVVVGVEKTVPQRAENIQLDGGILAPGLIDLQVNGGGGVLLNESPTLEGIETICRSHVQVGATSLLPTLITDSPEITAAALSAGIEAAQRRVPGFLGLHLEGPHLSLARKGAHDPKLIRPMEEADLAQLIEARKALPNLLLTVAAETVSPEQIRVLSAAGVIVSIGHSDAGFDLARAGFAAGASMATHLFNAMSQFGHREPGLVGAVLATENVFAGLIADGLHVHPASIGAALRAKSGPGRIFLVSDAMSVTGTDLQSFTLNDRLIRRDKGALRLEDGTLAGADLTLLQAVCFMVKQIGLTAGEALRMASLYPAQAMGISGQYGQLRPGAMADVVHVSDDLNMRGNWLKGKPGYLAPSA